LTSNAVANIVMIYVKSSLLKWELIGIAIISIVGSAMHFVYGWSGDLAIVGAISPVNESVWEHFKLGFFPTLVYGLIVYGFLKKQINNFAIGKAIELYLIPITIGAIFYAYTAIIRREILAVDISSFVLAVAIGQVVSYKILSAKKFRRLTSILGIALIVLLAAAFILFTFYPPNLPILMDSNTGSYGIQ
jgi:hypothetical protein